MKRRSIALLILASLVLAQISCGSRAVNSENTSDSTSDTTIEETTDDGKIKDDLPDKDFGGKEFPILTTS